MQSTCKKVALTALIVEGATG